MIRLVSVNIERSKHLDRVAAFLRSENADVVCLQEVCEQDIPRIQAILPAYEHHFTPMAREREVPGEPFVVGVAVFSRLGLDAEEMYYRKEEGLPSVESSDPVTFTHKNELVLFASVTQGPDRYRVGTTHFTWSEHSLPTDLQRTDMKKMLEILGEAGGFVLCGDLNAPRGGEIFLMLAEKYKDNIPPEYRTSIDVDLHRAGKIASENMDTKMVDGLFSTPEYIVSDVELHSGVSDHMAITATIAKTPGA